MAVIGRAGGCCCRLERVLALVLVLCAGAGWGTLAPARAAVSDGTATPQRPPASATAQPARATVLEAQALFHELGYPLGAERAGELGVRTRGALSYFQRKYGLTVTGYPDPQTLAEMQTVAASLHGGATVAKSQPRDIVEDVLGRNPPVLTIAVALAAIVALLALSGRRSGARQDSATAEDTIVAASEDR